MVSVSGYLIGSQEAAVCRCRQRLNSNGGTNIILRRSEAGQATTDIGTILPSSFGDSLRRNGTSMTPRSIAALRLSTIRITLRSLYIIIAGVSDWLVAKANMTNLKNGLLRLQ